MDDTETDDDPAARARAFREYMAERFPEMRPISSAPPMFLLNGFGTACYGARGRDPETGTYVKTLVLAGLFLPVLCLRAYRVAPSPDGGWYFLGRVPLSGLARLWNLLVLAGVLTALSVGAWSSHTSTPAYKAGEALAAGRAAEARGDVRAAVRHYAWLAGTARRAEGRAGIAALLAARAGDAPLEDLAAALRELPGSGFQGREALDDAALDALARRALAAAADDPRGGLALAAALRAVDEVTALGLREPLLEALVAREPDVEAASELAALYEGRGQGERAVALLRPLADRLGASDGARLLGQALAAEGDVDAAHRLLLPWLDARLAALHEAEAALRRALEQGQEAALQVLRSGGAGQAWYARYDSVGPAEQERQVVEFVHGRLQRDPAVLQARERLTAASDAVPVALELGRDKLQRAHALEGQARTDELLAAERLFLAVRGVAEGSPSFALGLAQVHYWLGRPDEGRALLDDLLEEERAPAILLGVAHTLREVGDHSACAALVEEAYEAAEDEATRYEAASFRSILALDMEERLVWLQRCDPAQPEVQSNLAQAQGIKALQRGEHAAAAEQLRRAADLLAKRPETATTLNNRALVLQRLFEAAGDAADHEASVDLLRRAERLEQGASIVKVNLAYVLLGQVALKVAREGGLDLGALRAAPDLDHLDWLHADADGEARLRAACRRGPDLDEALARLSALRVLAPKDTSHYALALDALGAGEDLEAHGALLRALEAAGPLDQEGAAADLRRLLAPPSADDVDGARRRLAALEARRLPADATPVTRAVRLGDLVSARLGLHALGERIDLDAAVAAAEEAHALAPSRGSSGSLVHALLTRALARAAAGAPTLAAAAERVGRSLSTAGVVCAALAGPDEAARAALATDADVQRAAALVAARAAALPRSVSTMDWALVQAVDPAAADALARALARDEVGRARRAIRLRLRPVWPAEALAAAWERAAAGDAEGARAALADAARRGVPLPFAP
ncbi:MAG: hypothetical protein M9894_27595 [Planctomycetes bacterium]|nr:hypothetical protein [Planctomycetota bacterium]